MHSSQTLEDFNMTRMQKEEQIDPDRYLRLEQLKQSRNSALNPSGWTHCRTDVHLAIASTLSNFSVPQRNSSHCSQQTRRLATHWRAYLEDLSQEISIRHSTPFPSLLHTTKWHLYEA